MNVFDLKTYYQKKVVPELQKTLNIKNMLALPRLAKVVVNIGVGRMREEKQIEEVIRYLKLITGQQPHARPTKKAIASFKTRQGMIVGYRVTLRGVRMYLGFPFQHAEE
ncbi:MAG: large subunit ribosomal protein L5 [Parcubacteria group bacterium Gr01-1014_66]|nr:MAG: large subunit ribosomal protein L5 [Parcubacteria group bacterium Gr01-1014_66]